MIRVLIADDHPVVRGGLAAVVGVEADLDVVAEAGDGVEAIALAEAHRPDVVLMDLRMPRMGGVEATAEITRGEGAPRVLILTTYESDDQILAAVEAGASG